MTNLERVRERWKEFALFDSLTPTETRAAKDDVWRLLSELAELREAVREHIDGNGAPNRTHDHLRQLIEEKP